MRKKVEEIIDDSVLQLLELGSVVKDTKERLLVLSHVGMLLIYLKEKNQECLKKFAEDFIIKNINNKNISKNNRKVFEEAKEGLDTLQEMMKDKIQEIIVRKFIKEALKDISKNRELLKQSINVYAEEIKPKTEKRELDNVDDFISKRVKKEENKDTKLKCAPELSP